MTIENFPFGDTKNLPSELAEATAKTATAFKRVRRAMTQVELWKKEHSLAEQEFTAVQKTQSDLIVRWQPDTGEITPKLEQLNA